ncbi:MAG: DNA alkylation repair protein [Candidatus Woesearchaeota archaeon]
MTNKDIRKRLFDLAEEKYRDFQKKLTPGEKTIIGVRLPFIRKLAKEISKSDYNEYLKSPFTEYHEECLLYGLVLGYIKTDINTLLKHVDKWLECINNWAVCDSGVMNMKALGKPQNSSIVWEYVSKKLYETEKPFIIRAMIVIMFSYFNNYLYVNKVADKYITIKNDHYYVKMALAWGISVIAVKYFDVAAELIKSKSLDKFTHNKAIQKCLESYRISTVQKEFLKNLKI